MIYSDLTHFFLIRILPVVVMEHCPVEIQHAIAFHACTDGGKTGCSLSLVSRYVRDATRQARFRSVALSGWRNVFAFAAITKKLDVPLHVSNLYIAAREGERCRGGGTSAILADAAPAAGEDERQLLEECIITVLRTAAPTLETLFFHVPYALYPSSRVLNLGYPQLLNLFIPSFELQHDANGVPPCFPVLRRLHVASKSDPWEALARSTPSLESIRLTYIFNEEETTSLFPHPTGRTLPNCRLRLQR